MKKLLGLILIIALIAGGWYLWHQGKGVEQTITIEPATSRPNPQNATFEFEDGPITLKDGSASAPISRGSAIEIETDLTNDIAYGDVNKDGKTDAAVLLVQQGGGSGVFIYVAAYISGNVAYKGSNAVFMGDRITPKSIKVDSSGDIVVSYLDRKPGEALASEPTVLTTKTFTYRGGNLEER